MNTNPNETYTSPNGRPYKVIGVEKLQETEKKLWEGRTPVFYYHWLVAIKFLDGEEPERIKLKYDYNDKLIGKENGYTKENKKCS